MRPDAQQLIQWADRLDCRARLPQLVRRLVHSTAEDLVEVDFAAGEGTGRPSFDGRVRAGTATAFVPQGLSVWEIGCSLDPAAKANADYGKRKSSVPTGVVPSSTTYVFVTPRRWSGRDQWAADRRKEEFWADVRAYDADSLEQWLELSPAASSWLTQLLGRPGDVQALEDYFTEWSVRTSPPTPHTLVLKGREEAQATSLDWLRGPPGVVSIGVPDVGEAAAFIYAVLRQAAGSDRERLLDRAIVVRSNASLRTVGLEGRNQIVVALECGVDVARIAARSGHHVVCATPGKPTGERIELGPLDRPGVAAVLESLGIDPETANMWSRETGGDTVAVRGRLGDRGPELPAELAPLLLAGSWSESSEADMAVVQEILGQGASELQRLLRTHSVGSYPALQRSGSTWAWRSRLEAWRALAGALIPSDLARYVEAAARVLSVEDPRFELEREERWMAAVKGKVLPHSWPLRHGLAETAAILASNSTNSEQVNAAFTLVYRILNGAKSWQQWATLDDLLPTLAEAAPLVFLREVRQLVEQHSDTVRSLRESSSLSGLSWSDHLNGLVWALETLAWHADFLDDACELLALVAEQEAMSPPPGDRALRSLREVLLPWLPHTTADLDARIGAISSIARRRGAVRFAFLLSLLPQFGGDSSTGTHKPSWRSWLADWKEGVTHKEVHAAHVAVWNLVLEQATAEPGRWADVVPHLHQLSEHVHRPKALAALEALEVNTLSRAARERLWTTLRKELHRHRSFREAKWAMPEDDLRRLESLYRRIEPSDLEVRYRWLFSDNPELPNHYGHDWAAEREAVAAAQAIAAKELVTVSGIDAVLRVAAVEQAAVVGWALAKGTDLATCQAAIAASVAAEDDWAWRFRAGAGGGLAEERGLDVFALIDQSPLPPTARADLCLGMGFKTATWNTVAAWGEEAQRAYWSKVRPFLRENVAGELSTAVHELVAVDRAVDAIDLMGMHLHRFKKEAGLKPEDIVVVLTAALQPGGRRPGGMDVHHAAELMNILQAAGSEWEANLVKLEWAWFQAMDHTRKPTMLYRALSESPQFFVQVLSMVFRGEGDAPSEPDEEASARAMNAYRLLNGWNLLPGTDTNGDVDVERLQSWVSEVRRIAAEARRAVIADLRIGEVLARSPVGSDGIWPHEAVRDLLERLRGTGDIQQGFVTGRYNQRGVFSKAIGEGGRQEREIAGRYMDAANALRRRWPVVSRFLRDIADGYLRDAEREDQRGARDKEAYIWAASNEDRLAEWVDSLQAEGRYTFTVEDAAVAIGRPASEVKQTCSALVTRTRIVSPEDGFYVVVPLEYRTAGCPPPSWFIDDWLAWSNTAYAVGLLTSAALHGAAHQQPQAFQVIVPKPRHNVALGRVRVQFVVDEAVAALPADNAKTETGTMRLLSPAATAVSLVQHLGAVGGADVAANVFAELVEKIDPEGLRLAAAGAVAPTLQRLGYLLSVVGADEAALVVQGMLSQRDRAPVWLRSDDAVEEGSTAAEPWLVAVEYPVELDQ